MSDNFTIDANGAAHNGPGLKAGGGQFTTPLSGEQPADVRLDHATLPVIPQRPLPQGNTESARAQRNELKRAAITYSRFLMLQNPELLAMIRSAAEDVIPENSSMYPEVTVLVHEETEDEISYAELRCPWCGYEGSEGSFHEIGIAERYDKIEQLSDDGTALVLDRNGDADFDGLHMACENCDNPVSLPDSVNVSHN